MLSGLVRRQRYLIWPPMTHVHSHTPSGARAHSNKRRTWRKKRTKHIEQADPQNHTRTCLAHYVRLLELRRWSSGTMKGRQTSLLPPQENAA